MADGRDRRYASTGGYRPGTRPTTTRPAPVPGQPATPAQPAQPTYDLSNAQGAFNAQLASNNQLAAQQSQWNRINESGPYGSANYTMGPNGQVTRNYQLNAGQQQIDDQRTQQDIGLGGAADGLVKDAQGRLSSPYDISGAPKLLGSDDMLAERQRVEGQIYGRFNERMAPEFEAQSRQLEQRLAERGIPVGSPAFKAAMDDLYRRQSDSKLDAQTRATELGGNELTRTYGLSADTRDRYINDYNNTRRASLADLASVYGLQRGVQQQPVSGISQVNFPSLSLADLGIQYQQLSNQRLAASKSGGGGAGGPDFFAKANYQAELAEKASQADFDRKLQYLAATTPKGASFSDIALALGGQALGGAAGAFAQNWAGSA